MYYQGEQQPYIPMSDPYSTTTKQNKLPSMLDMCYLSGKIYEDPEKDKSLQCSLPEGYEVFRNCSSLQQNWQMRFRVYERGLKIALYFNDYYKCSVMVIRGTEPKDIHTLLADFDYFINNSAMPMFEAALNFYIAIKTKQNAFLSAYPLVACTGHSLGGILVKMLAPITRLSTYTFNSPGVLEILKALIHHYQRPQYVLGVPARDTVSNKAYMLLTERGTLKSLMPGQEVLTYIANADPIGNCNWQKDFGEHIHLPILNSERTKYINSSEYSDYFEPKKLVGAWKHLVNAGLSYHGIVEMFSFLKSSSIAQNDRARNIKYAS